MHRIAIAGSNANADVMARLLRRGSLADVALFADEADLAPPCYTLTAPQSRILIALGLRDASLQTSYVPDRQQIRLSPSGYLLAELPLGDFYAQRYGAPLLNISADGLRALLAHDMAQQPSPGLQGLEQHYDLVINTTDQSATTPTPLHHAFISGTPQRANITWLAAGAVAWQRSTPDGTHYYFYHPLGEPPVAAAWPDQLLDAVQAARICDFGFANQVRPKPNWLEGHVVYMGHACLSPHPTGHDTWQAGFEDAWVLSRMLENYEEDMHDGLAEYVRYREPRCRRLQRHNELLRAAYNEPAGLRRFANHVGLALRTRFIPELAMQKLDWLHGYDCIKGFN